jgi:hypothetical protein
MMWKKVLWTLLVSASSALAYRLSARVWHVAARQPPPEAPSWAKLLVGNPLKNRLQHR